MRMDLRLREVLFLAANVVSLSFKNNTEEINLYNYLKTKSSPSAYIKELIKQDIGDRHIDVKNNKVGGATDNILNDANREKKETVVVNKISNVSSLFK